MKRKWILLLSLVLPACCSLSHPQQPQTNSVLTLAHVSSATYPLPHHLSQTTFPGHELCYETLLTKTTTGYTLLLAKSIEASSNQSLEITLYHDAYFHDLTPVTATHVQSVLQYFASENTAPYIKQLCQATRITIKNDFSFTLFGDTKSSITLLTLLPIFKPHPSATPLGSGPYQLLPKHQDTIIYQKHNYWGEHQPFAANRNHLHEIRYHLFHSTFDASIAFSNHQVDGYIETSASRYARLQQTSPATTRTIHHPKQQYTQNLVLNPRHLLLGDPAVRESLNYLWMGDILNEKLYYQQYQVLESSSSLPLPPSPHQRLMQASTLLANHGWEMNDQHVLTKNQQPLTMKILLYHHQWDAAIAHFSYQLRRVGVLLSCEYVSKAQYYHRVSRQMFDVIIEPIIIDNNQILTLPSYYSVFNSLPKIEIIPIHLPYPQSSSAIYHNLRYDLWIIPLFSIDRYRLVLNPHFSVPEHTETIDPSSWWYTP